MRTLLLRALVPNWVLAPFDIAQFPASLQPMIQAGYLETHFEDFLTANNGYWTNADTELFTETYEKNRGVTITRTRPGLKAPVVTPASNSAAQTPPNDGVTPSDFAIEQYTFSPFELTDGRDLDLIGTNFAIVNRFTHQVTDNYLQSVQSVDLLARDTYIANYAVGCTIATGTAGIASDVNVRVDDLRGFDTVITVGASSTNGVLKPTSHTNKLPITVYPADGTANMWTANCEGTTADVSNITNFVPKGSMYGTQGAPTSNRAVGISGTVQIDSVTRAIAVGDVLVTGDGPAMVFSQGIFHFSYLTANGLLSTNILDAVNLLENNAVPFAANRQGDDEGTYVVHCSPDVMRSLYNDSDFKQANQTLGQSEIYLRGKISKYLGVTFLPNTNAPKIPLAGYGHPGYANFTVIAGQGAIVDCWYAGLEDWAMSEFNPAYVVLQEGIAQILMPAYADRQGRQMHIDFLTIRDMVAPTDVTRASVILTGTGSRCARAVGVWTWSSK